MPAKKSEQTWSALWKILGFSSTVIKKWRKLDGAPLVPDPAAWRTFIRERGLGREQLLGIHEVKLQIAKENLRKIERENAVAEGEMIPMDDLESFLAEWSAKYSQLLSVEMRQNLPPMIVGKNIGEVRAECDTIFERLRETVNRDFEKWMKPNAAAPTQP